MSDLVGQFLCTGFACSDDTEGFGFPNLVAFGIFLVFHFSFSQFHFLFLEIGVVNYMLWVYNRLNNFKITEMIYIIHTSLIMLDKDVKYIYFLPICSTSASH